MRSFLVFLVFVWTQFLVFSQNTIQEAVNRLKNDPDLEHASISFQLTEMETNKIIASYNPQESLPSASTTKLFATAGALEILGPDYRPSTRLYISGKIDQGVLTGDLIIRGGGDITLGSRYFNETGKERAFFNIWIDTLKKLGITKIIGNVISDGSDFGYHGVPEGWDWSDIGNYYGTAPSGICIYDNSIRFYFRTGSKPGSKAELVDMWPKTPNLNFTNGITGASVGRDNSCIFGGPYSFERYSTGTLPLNSMRYEVKGSHPDPELQLSYDLHALLGTSGIEVQGSALSFRYNNLSPLQYDNYKLIYTHYGRTVKEIAVQTNMKSINLFAEGLICLIGYKVSGKGTTEEGIRQLEKHFNAKINLHGLILYDGSGLSRCNGISAAHFCDLLVFMQQTENYNTYFSTLPVAGRSGTISSICRDQAGEGRVFAKSGSMNKIRSYSGYINSKSGKKMAFAITLNNYSCTGSAASRKIEQLLNSIAIY